MPCERQEPRRPVFSREPGVPVPPVSCLSMAVLGRCDGPGPWVTAPRLSPASSSVLRELETGLGTLQSC